MSFNSLNYDQHLAKSIITTNFLAWSKTMEQMYRM